MKKGIKEKGQKGIKKSGTKFHSEAETQLAGPKSTTEPAFTKKTTTQLAP